MDTAKPFVDEDDDERDVCWLCPSLRYPGGGFDVFERPSAECAFDPADGFRYTADGVPVCVHPYRVGLPPGRYASEGVPVPEVAPPVAVAPLAPVRRDGPAAAGAVPAPPARVGSDGPTVRRAARAAVRRAPAPYAGVLPEGLPDELGDLARWVGELAGGAAPEQLAEVLAGAEAAALTRFPEEQVLAVLRRVLSGG